MHLFLVENFEDYSLYFNAREWSQHRARSAQRIPAPVPNFAILRERPLLLILRLKLPSNVAHGDHSQHVHSACPHTMTSLPAHLAPA